MKSEIKDLRNATAAIVLNGEGLPRCIEGDFVICADGGYDLLSGQKCDMLLGDFDSLKSKELFNSLIYEPTCGKDGLEPCKVNTTALNLQIKEGANGDKQYEINGQSLIVKQFSTDKDMTDGELALRCAIDMGFRHINIYGADGGFRSDHILGNYNLLYLANKLGASAQIISGKDEKTCIARYVKKEITIRVQKGDIISILPYSARARIKSSCGLKYPLEGLLFEKYSSLGLSNEALTNEVKIELLSGSILLFHVKHA